MLRKRTRSIEKDQQMSYLTMSGSVVGSFSNSENEKRNSFFNLHGLFNGLSSKGLSDIDSAKSTTSPLDFRIFSKLGNPFKFPKSFHYGRQKSWDTNKVGLSIIDTLDNDKKLSGNVVGSESKNILFGPQMRIKTAQSQTDSNSFAAPKFLHKNYAIFPYTHAKPPRPKGNSDAVFEIGETPSEKHEPLGKFRSLDSCRPFLALAGCADSGFNVSSGGFGLGKLDSLNSPPPIMVGGNPSPNNFPYARLSLMPVSIGSGNGFTESLAANEIELSEDYTRVVLHGSDPRTTHFFGDCILEYLTNDSGNAYKTEAEGTDGVIQSNIQYPSDVFLSFCCSCNKNLKGKDIYLYRGEKAFCSKDCREPEVLINDEMEEIIMPKSSPKSDDGEELSVPSFFIAA